MIRPVGLGMLRPMWFWLDGFLFPQQAAGHVQCVLPFADPCLEASGVSEASVDSTVLDKRMWSHIRVSWSSVSNPTMPPSSPPGRPFCSSTSPAACGRQLSQDGDGILIVSCCLWDTNTSWIKANFGVWSIKCQIWKRTCLRLLCCRKEGHPRPRGREGKKEMGERTGSFIPVPHCSIYTHGKYTLLIKSSVLIFPYQKVIYNKVAWTLSLFSSV